MFYQKLFHSLVKYPASELWCLQVCQTCTCWLINPYLIQAFIRISACAFPVYPMEDSSSLIYQTFWKDGKHYHPLDLTWTESHSFGISAPTFLEIRNGFSVLWELGRAATVSISQTEGEVAEDVNSKPEVLLECIWMQDLPEEHTPPPPQFRKWSALSFLLTPPCPCIATPFSTSPAPNSLYVQLATPQRLCLPVPNDSQTPTCFVLLIFPLPRDGV